MKIKIISIFTAVALMAGIAPAKADDGRQIVTTIFGAAAGGLLGAQVGKGNGKLVATATGAVLGAVIGRELGSPNDGPYYEDPYYDEPVVYNPPKKERYSYGNRNAQPVQKRIIIEEQTVVTHVVVHKYEPEYSNGRKHKYKNKHKKKHWKKNRKHKKHYYKTSYDYDCDRKKCWNYD